MYKKINYIILNFLLISNLIFANDKTNANCPTVAVSGSNVSCYGYTDGSARVAISNGSGSYTITWSNGVTTNLNQGLAVGTYTVNVKDNTSGCSVIGAYVVSSPDPIATTETITDVDCYNNTTGKAMISVIGGTTPYTYAWKNSIGGTITTLKNLINVASGSYTIEVTDAKGCKKTDNYTISQPAEALNSSNVTTNVSCFGGSNAEINIDVWGGTPYYTYAWSTNASTQDVSNLTAGTYSLTITDTKGCTINKTFAVTEPQVIGGIASTTSVLCNGGASGSASYSVTGGTAPFSYSWQNTKTLFSANTSTLNNVIADNYNLTITDANSCTKKVTMIITEPSALAVSVNSYHDVSCNGGNDGAIDILVGGGSVPYTYSWQNLAAAAVSIQQDITNVTANSYTVRVTDLNGCIKDLSQVITEPSAPVLATETITNVLCYDNNTGAIELSVSGGTAPYTCSWSSGQSSQNVTNLIAATYSYSVIDSKNCPYTNTVTVTQPLSPLAVANSITDANCFGDENGKIDLTVTGGTAPYSYSWKNGDYQLSVTSQDLFNFLADDYRYEVTDANGCKEIDTLTISQPTKLISTLTGVNILCKNGNNGSTDLTVSGGIQPYSYSWSNGYTTDDLSTLTDGTYNVIVSDNHNCITTNSIVLTEPEESLSFTYKVKKVLCNDGTDGEIDLTVAGGTFPYFYNWSNGATDSHIKNLTSAMYQFTVTDNNGCLLTNSIFVNQPAPLTLNEVITPVTCKGLADGKINVAPQGGTAPYQFTWYNSKFALSTQTEDLINFPADIYQVEIVDSVKCFYEMFFTIAEPDSLKIDYTFNKVSCASGSDGNINVTITGGNPNYTINWSNNSNIEDQLNIVAGTYKLNVVDTKNCKDSITVEIVQPDSIKMTFDLTEITCIDQHDGVAQSFPTGGNGGYNYLWSNTTTNAKAENLSNEFYSITVTDILGCIGIDSVYIPKNTKNCIETVNTFTPNNDMYNDTWFIKNTELYPNADMKIFNRWGNIVHKQIGTTYVPWNGQINGVDAPADTYYFILNLNTPDRDPITGIITIVR